MQHSVSQQQKIGKQFLVVACIFAAVFSAIIFYQNVSEGDAHMDETLRAQARMALEFDLAIRSYVAESIRPFAMNHVGKDEFAAHVMSTSFVARNVFEKVRKEIPDYIMKFSSDNPRNPANQATQSELAMIKYFNENPDVDRWSGRIRMGGTDYLACFRARRAKESCLQCHGRPEDAPASLVRQYGATAGFHRPVGEVIALDTVAIPVGTGRASVRKSAVKGSAILIAGLLLFIGAVYVMLERLVRSIVRQNEFMDDVVESLVHPFYVVDAQDYGIKIANSAAWEGGLPENATCYMLTHGRDKPCDDAENPCPMEILKQGEDSAVVEHVHHDQNGNVKNVEVHANPILDSNGKLSQMIEYSLDITDRKKEEEQTQKHLIELEHFNQLAVGRELQMIELKKEVDALLREMGRGDKYRSHYDETTSDVAKVGAD